MPKDHRVLIANPSPDVYGSDLQMLESISAMRSVGWKVVVALPRDGQLIPRIKDRGAAVAYVDFPVLRRANQSATAFAGMAAEASLAVPRLASLLRRWSPDALYVNTVTLPWWLLAGRLSGVPTVCHLHEAENTDSTAVRKMLLAPLGWADRIIVISEATLTSMAEVSPRLVERARLIYNGVPDRPLPAAPAPVAPPTRIASVGRLSPRKAPHILLEAIGILRQDGVDVDVTLVGTAFEGYEWYENSLRARAAESDLAGHVTFAGYVSPVWPAIDSSHLVVQPSLREPFGNAVIEAHLSERAVIATDALGHKETIEHGKTGLLVPPEDATAMANAIKELVNNPHRAEEMGKTARLRAIQRFGVARYQEEVVALMRSAISARRRGAGPMH